MLFELFAALALVTQIVPVETLNNAPALQDALLKQLNTLESIECNYVYCCNKRAQEQPNNMELRWKDGWLWYASRLSQPSDHPDAFSVIVESVIDQIVSGYYGKLNSDKGYQHTNYDRLRFMAYNELSPLTILGVSSPRSYYSFTHNLRETLRAVETPFIEKDNRKILLYLYPEPPDGDYREFDTKYGKIVHFDEEGHVVQIDYVLRPGCSLEEIRLFSGTDSISNIHRLFASDVFEDYHNIGGFSLPVRLHRALYAASLTEEFRQLLEKLQPMSINGEIPLCEYEMRIYAAIPEYFVETEWRATIDPDSIRINNPNLSRADLEVVPPKEPTVTWDIASGDFVDEFGEGNYEKVKKDAEARRIARIKAKMSKDYSLPIGVAIGTLSAALLATIIVLKMRGKR